MAYGPDDQVGMLNEIDAGKVIEAARLVRRGKIYDLGRILDETVPAFPGRSFRQHLTTSAHLLNRRGPNSGPAGLGENNVNWIVEIVSATSQMGTHIDALNHLQIGDQMYNGNCLGDIAEEWGTNRLGAEMIPQIITRGVLVDIAGLHGRDRLEKGMVIPFAEVQACLAKGGIALRRGDALFFHTGWGSLWDDHAAYLSGEPGPGIELASWMAEQGVAVSGCDTWSFGPVPPENLARPFEVPQILNVRHGMFIIENLFTSELAKEAVGACEFMFVLTHAKLRGATGAWVSPVGVV